MENIKKKKEIVKSLLKEIFQMIPPDDRVDNQIIIDDQHGHYLLTSVGWINDYREFNSFVHIDVKPDGKVWVQHDGTDQKLVMQLIEKGVLKKDIVLAFHAPYRRKLIPEFAVN